MNTARVILDYKTLMAASYDEGMRSMRKAGRTSWNEDDWNAAAGLADRLRPYLLPSSSPEGVEQ